MKNGALSHGPVSHGRPLARCLDGETDRQLLDRFVRDRDGDAFAALVRRYGSMVLGACRRVLSNAEEAEDAFQATFLVLVRKARSIAQPELLGNWLYGVAYRIARKARARNACLAQQERPPVAMSPTDPVLEAAWRELHARLDEELQRLPAKYRAPLVLCYLEGLSNKEAANRLGWPVGSISYRLARGREMLRDRLRGRHPDVPPALMAALPIWGLVPADLLARLQGLVVKLGNALSRGGEAADAVVSPAAQAMAAGALKAMAAERHKHTLLLALVSVVLALVLVPVAWAGWSALALAAGPAAGPPPAPATGAAPAPCHDAGHLPCREESSRATPPPARSSGPPLPPRGVMAWSLIPSVRRLVMFRWLDRMIRERRPGTRQRRPAAARLRLEALEERTVLSTATAFLQTNLVSDLAGVAQVQDPNLVNPWGISESTGSPFWISDNNSGQSTLYSVPGANNTPVSVNGLVVSIPTPGDPLGASGAPTGTVFNIDGGATGGFKVSGVDKNGNSTSASAVFLFATEDGTIVGWNPGVNPDGFDPNKAGTYGIIAVDNSQNPTADAGAVYKGLTIATDGTGRTLLYAANFRSGKVDVFDANFNPVDLGPSAFTDRHLPAGYAPFNVQELNGKIYVTYALQNADKHDDVAGAGNGFVDVFNLDGTPGLVGGKVRLVSHGNLNSPWGLAIAPSNFGKFANALLVGNFGDGHIDAYNPANGKFLGQLTGPDGDPIQIDGLWALKVGNGHAGGDANTVYFTAGIDHENHGLFGSLSVAPKGSSNDLAEQQELQAAIDVAQISLQTVIDDANSGADATKLQQDNQTLNTALVDLVRAEQKFAADQASDSGAGKGSAHHAASDNVFADLERLLGVL